MNQGISLATLEEIMSPEYVAKNKISTIKTLRQMSGEGLRETKDFLEQIWMPFLAQKGEPKKVSKKDMGSHITGSLYGIPTFETDDQTPASDLSPPAFILGHSYRQFNSEYALIVGISNRNTSYETVYSIDGDGKPIHRYNRRDFGRCTGSDHNNPDPRNLEVPS